MSEFAIFRVQKLQRGQALRRAFNHLENHEMVAEISRPENIQNNLSRVLIEKDVLCATTREIIKKHNETSKRKLRKDAAVAIEMIFTYSPSVANKINADDFVKAVIEFINENFASKGMITIRFDWHTDEKTNHLHFLGYATKSSGEISAREFLGNKKDMSILQDKFAEKVEHLGLKRGLKRQNKKRHKPLFQYYKELEQKAEEYERQIEQYENDHRIVDYDEGVLIANDILR